MKAVRCAMLLGVLWLAMLVKAADENKDKPKDVWGDTFRGVALSVSVPRQRFKVGEEIELVVTAKNFGEKPVDVLSEGPTDDWRPGLFRADGSAVVRHEWARKAEAPPDGPTRYSRSVAQLAPDKELKQIIRLSTWFHIEEKGDYYLVVVRRIWSWDKGSAMSNLVRFSVVGAEEQKKP